MTGQFEQQLNAAMLAQLKYGKNAQQLTPETIGDFLYRLPEYETALADYAGTDNHEIQAKLGELVADDAALALQFHRQRQ